MPSANKGVPPPANINEIIYGLFQNEKIKNTNETKTLVLFSAACLTDKQKKSLTYPENMTPIDLYLVYQTDKYDNNDNLKSTTIQLVSFVKKNTDLIYGVYFNLDDQPRYDPCDLTKSSKPINLSNNAIAINSDYLEAYNDINGTIVILSLSTQPGHITSSLQYSNKSKYYYEELSRNGIVLPLFPETKLTGLSKNLSKYNKGNKHCHKN